MPTSTDDALKVEAHINRIFSADGAVARAEALRRLFVEVLDFHGAAGQVSLEAAKGADLPDFAELIASLEGVRVLWVGLATKRVNKREAAEAARLMEQELGQDLLLVCTNRDENLGDASQLHLILPDFTSGTVPKLRRRTVERGLPQRTAYEQIAGIYSEDHPLPVRQALKKAFDVEPVTRDFFRKYDELFKAAKGLVTGLEDEDRHLFVQTLFNRLLFVHFLSRKGWLTFEGDKDYLKALWRDYQATDGEANFHRDRLRRLFFDGLSNPESQSRHYPDIGKVPFLNGGLFEPGPLDERKGVIVPDAAIEPLLNDLFDRFNFTVMESTPLDVEVAVDPEMLGKVFEELVTGRHKSGSYYTPRPVVSFMCREALKGYLEGRGTGLDAEAIRAFVDEQRTEGVIGVAEARKLAAALGEVTVVDPACGSGAYLLGMMQELVELQRVLFNAGATRKSLHQLKLEIIERNLYGVDNDQFAANIAMLRLWLSLAIEDEPPIEPLPNLDFKIVCGDSLLGPDPSGLSFDRVTIEKSGLGQLKGEYLRESDDAAKKRLRGEIDAAREQVRVDLGSDPVPESVVDWRVEFAEVFAARKGFDIILANPPYVVIKDARLRAMYAEGVFGRINTYGLFIQRSLQLLAAGGQLLFINPRTLLTDRYFVNLRKLIKRQSELKGVVLISDRHNTFERVLQECIVFHVVRQEQPAARYMIETRAINVPDDLNDPHGAFVVDSDRVFLADRYSDAFYIGSSDLDYRVFERMHTNGLPLPALGLKAETGKVQFDKYREYALAQEAEGASRLIWAENVQRYAVRASHKRAGKEWLAAGVTDALQPKVAGDAIVTQRTTANEQPRRIIATILPGENRVTASYTENGTNLVDLAEVPSAIGCLVIAALNSSVMDFAFRHLNSNVHVSAGELNSLPLPSVPDDATLERIRALVVRLVEQGGVDAEPSALAEVLAVERALDALVGSLYGFSPDDIAEVQQRLPSYSDVYGLTGEERGLVGEWFEPRSLVK